jgi:hypothetical protein
MSLILVTYATMLRKSRESSVGIATRYGVDSPDIESRWDARFTITVQTNPGTHPASYTTVTGALPGVMCPGRGTGHPTSYAEVKERVQLYFCFPSGLPWPVLGYI